MCDDALMACEPSASEPASCADAATLPFALAPAAVLDASRQPEKRLMLAVLEEAVATFQRTARDPGRRAQRLHGEAVDWFASRDVSWPYAYRNVCDALGIEADWLRDGLWRWRALQPVRPTEATGRARPTFRRVGGSRARPRGRAIGLRPAR
ncbi:MAG: hypothetical protein KIT14_07785 [bacterium]|nr:hypothetical protein [bacterium]